MVNSVRDATPVRIASPSRTLSLTAAGRGAACGERSLTSFTARVTRASFDCPAFKQAAVRRRQTSKPRFKISARGAEEGEELFMGEVLKFDCQRYPATDVGDAVIEHALI